MITFNILLFQGVRDTMENIRLVHSLDRPNDLKTIVRQDLRDLGIKAPKIKSKKSKKLNQSRSSTQQVK